MGYATLLVCFPSVGILWISTGTLGNTVPLITFIEIMTRWMLWDKHRTKRTNANQICSRMDVNDSVVRWNAFIDNQNQYKTSHTVNQLNTSHTFNLATKKTPRATKQLLNNAKTLSTMFAVDWWWNVSTVGLELLGLEQETWDHLRRNINFVLDALPVSYQEKVAEITKLLFGESRRHIIPVGKTFTVEDVQAQQPDTEDFVDVKNLAPGMFATPPALWLTDMFPKRVETTSQLFFLSVSYVPIISLVGGWNRWIRNVDKRHKPIVNLTGDDIYHQNADEFGIFFFMAWLMNPTFFSPYIS